MSGDKNPLDNHSAGICRKRPLSDYVIMIFKLPLKWMQEYTKLDEYEDIFY